MTSEIRTDRSVGRISDGDVELFAFEDHRIISRTYDATLAGYRSSRIDVISRHHAHGDARSATPHYRVRHLSTPQILCFHRQQWAARGIMFSGRRPSVR